MSTTTITNEGTTTMNHGKGAPEVLAASFEVAGARRFWPARIDGAGAACSALCAVHCVAVSLLPGALAFLGWGALMGPALETGFATSALLFAGLSLWFGYSRHRARGVLVLFSFGMIGLIAGRVLEESGSEIGSTATIVAGLLLVTAHGYRLWSARRRARATAQSPIAC